MRGFIVAVVAVGLSSVVQAADAPVAKVGSQTITQAELEKRVKSELLELDTQRYEILHEGLEDMVADELLKQEAKARGTTVAALTKQEIDDKAEKPTDEQAKTLYEANKERLGDATFESIKPKLFEHLREAMIQDRREQYVDELKKKYKTEIFLKEPTVEVAGGGRPSRGGGPNAPVTIIEFSDYECPFCKSADVTVQKVMNTYGDKVRLIHRDFPLSFHQRARPAAEAARCAEAQGKFWPYHEKLFASKDLSDAKLQAIAAEVGLDKAKFDECLAKQPYTASIDQDIAAGAEAGVSGTPAFFINGRMLSGAQPFEKFKEVIDQELAKAKPAKAS